MRISKVFRFGERGRVEILADLLNLANDAAETGLVTDLYVSPKFGQPNTFVLPFRAMLGVKFVC